MAGFLRFLYIFVFAAATFHAAYAQQSAVEPASPPNILDGRQFAGEFIPAGKSSGRRDDFVFVDGKFHSKACLEFGFTPGPYWIRMENGRLHFLARLTSDENGVMTYEGTVDGSKLDARIEWIKPRWYWTMKRSFRFRGMADSATGER